MKEVKIILITALTALALTTNAQSADTLKGKKVKTTALEKQADPFKAHLVNDEFQVWLDIDFINKNIIIPGQEIFGELPGYFGAKRDTRKWIISEATVKGKTAKLLIINDYGSEDLTAELRLNSNGTYTLKQLDGSTIKIVVNNKWLKIPKEIVFKRQ
ncbi:MAG: hypothetical protein E6507_06550 [Prevotella bivia]|jgi:hypothetical protein|uniref:Beta-lactamase-inhibitor-like PepSY-like domain-containing protein n=2 Tax=Prevotella bivia TaxID=28125 RepID=A0A096BN60_9BACT|nr:hypothetical protein [Prevotella bivia]KGF23198.1 hypothetical protein HMPREF1651_02970 [Prevotella bivia DNF00188]KGF37391.1 hypothetical protein HMPREF2136_06660 [Prevotella bivia DNF00650]KGF44127.1 hypothetical protein HMPREF0647_08055 [Prevotella bivia DNF00320]KXO17524.1 hypothetical protein HMPREF3202_01012 [Prevotella bivia]KXU57166.1 hypothetical protein HMPREF3218_0201564 [Prevotella bivia]